MLSAARLAALFAQMTTASRSIPHRLSARSMACGYRGVAADMVHFPM
jgi:hypothetical protein